MAGDRKIRRRMSFGARPYIVRVFKVSGLRAQQNITRLGDTAARESAEAHEWQY